MLPINTLSTFLDVWCMFVNVTGRYFSVIFFFLYAKKKTSISLIILLQSRLMLVESLVGILKLSTAGVPVGR